MITKSENREISKLTQWREAGFAEEWGVTGHPEFIA